MPPTVFYPDDYAKLMFLLNIKKYPMNASAKHLKKFLGKISLFVRGYNLPVIFKGIDFIGR